MVLEMTKEKPLHLEEVEDYWTKRSENFSDGIENTLESGDYIYWLNSINEEIRSSKKLRVLDCGCGPGFFSIILGREGHHIEAVDYSDGMVDMANENFRKYGVFAKARKMDAHNLEFEDGSFDLVVARNIMWTLADPPRVYSEWMRVLAPGGKIVNFDGNWKLHNHDGAYAEVWEKNKERGLRLKEKTMRHDFGPSQEDIDRMEKITAEDFMVCHHRRPLWDMEILIGLGAVEVKSEMEGAAGDYVEKDGKREYLPGFFKITATKGDSRAPNGLGHWRRYHRL